MSSYKKTKLYKEQQLAFDRIIQDVEKPNKTKPLVLFVCGAAGTGKSEIIKHLVSTVGEEHVILTAPTAKAARNISGKTIHRAMNFRLNGADQPILPHPSLKLFIIDEISMCDANLFARVERRLRQLMNNPNVLFGGCTVVMFGDLLQIPPVSGKWIFNSPIWKQNVQYVELETIVRQETDPEFGKMLKRWRLGRTTHADQVFLNSLSSKVGQTGWRDYVGHFLENYDQKKNMMMLAYTNCTIATLNQMTTTTLFPNEGELYNLTRDTYTLSKNKKVPTVQKEVMFRVGQNSRVMVYRNIDDNLVNGEIGLVKNIKSLEDNVVEMDLDLCSTKTVYKLQVFQSPTSNVGASQVWVTQFPIHSAYALTYHKAQGQTLDKVFLTAREKLPPALFYVGASRVRTREDLHILSPNAHVSIRADVAAIREYKRLRKSIGKTHLL